MSVYIFAYIYAHRLVIFTHFCLLPETLDVASCQAFSACFRERPATRKNRKMRQVRHSDCHFTRSRNRGRAIMIRGFFSDFVCFSRYSAIEVCFRLTPFSNSFEESNLRKVLSRERWKKGNRSKRKGESLSEGILQRFLCRKYLYF